MVTGTPLLRFLWRIGHLDSHVRQIIALIAAVIAFVLSSRYGHAPVTHFIAIWDIYAIVVIVMAWVTIWTADPRTIQRQARLQDSSRTLIFVFVIVAACMSLLAVILVIHEHRALQNTGALHLFMAALAVVG
jgi:uncharacterized membrane protein